MKKIIALLISLCLISVSEAHAQSSGWVCNNGVCTRVDNQANNRFNGQFYNNRLFYQSAPLYQSAPMMPSPIQQMAFPAQPMYVVPVAPARVKPNAIGEIILINL